MILWFTIGVAILIGFIGACNFWIANSTEDQVFDKIKDVPERAVALVLGTTRTVNGRFENPYFSNRIRAAVELYREGKVKHFLLSGDNSRHTYNEPEDMKNALIKAGIPASAITLDYAGFRTLDSIVRCKKVFGQTEILIISQQFHNHRAVFIAQYFNIDVIAYNAEDVVFFDQSKIKLREYLARCKAVLDLYLLKTQPKFLGKSISINIS